ncbi:SGNH/GDSL hydrolase family protein [Kutzneria sp. CA-103260]|uniref:SGNH/GDSL hydrolase family protein n=1 Tax=Kutzneria sp. CA-103260 TaxID=2802641 RepID=UPI001BA8C57F|nr:SGNH/GDSL hydrolase family protein [Kutzneria sp. CA-103260]QUQ63826.1 SGNH/GDSL hydrolase family protein [Kutzneria sp. CA-103260]
MTLSEGATYRRYVALGDSQTEGVGDGDDQHGLIGWADRLATRVAASSPDVLYANLAVRGKLAGQVRAEQLDAALALKPDLATVAAGLNDMIRPGFDAARVAGHLEDMFAALTAAGARVATFTFPDVARMSPLFRPLAPRVLELNALIRAAAARHGVAVADFYPHAAATDPRIWAVDRIHANPEGHARIAGAMAEALGLPGSDRSWSQPLPPRPWSWAHRVRAEAVWLAVFVGPWLLRRLRGRSSGDGRTAKRPTLTPVTT